MIEFTEDIFQSISDIRHKCMVDRVRKYLGEIKDIKGAIKKQIEGIQFECGGRGTKTPAFDIHCKNMALLLKARNTIKEFEQALESEVKKQNPSPASTIENSPDQPGGDNTG